MNKTTLLPAVIEQQKKHFKELRAKAPAPPLNQRLIQCNVSPLASLNTCTASTSRNHRMSVRNKED